jgi:hypothetical protein
MCSNPLPMLIRENAMATANPLGDGIVRGEKIRSGFVDDMETECNTHHRPGCTEGLHFCSGTGLRPKSKEWWRKSCH